MTDYGSDALRLPALDAAARAARPLSYGGLTAKQVTVQSLACHPEWDAKTHAEYLVFEEGFDPSYVETLPIVGWLHDWLMR